MVPVSSLRHIEGFSAKRVAWLVEKIRREGVWDKPIAIDARHNLVMDGQHRMEAARALRLRRVPAVRFRYSEVRIWSLRPKQYGFDWREVTRRARSGDIYPYKTVKHAFPRALPRCELSLAELRR